MRAVADVMDVATMAGVVLTQAIEFCGEKMRLDSAQAVVDRLREGDGQMCGYCHYSVAKQVGRCLGELDYYVKAAYIYDYDAASEDLWFEEAGQGLPIHLLVWVERKTAALNGLVQTWECALARSYAEILGRPQLTHVLDVQVVDDAQVEKRTGYGALVSSLHNRPIEVWKR